MLRSSVVDMAGWLEPDRRLDRSPRWVATDLALTALFVWITIVSLRSDAYVDEFGPIEGVGWLLALSPTLLLPARRFAPACTLAAATLLYLWASASQGDSNAPLAAPFFAYSVAMTRPATTSGAIVAVAAAAMSTSTLYGPGAPDALITLLWPLLFGSGWLVATSIRRNQTRADRLRHEVTELEQRQADVARRAIFDERVRIARELHDAVGHAVNVMVLQAGAARLANDHSRATEALGNIERIGRNALTDLDHLLGLLHDDEAATRSPRHGIDDIAALVDQLRVAGADITFRNEVDGAVDWRTGAAVHRIAQEALTNAVKHAGRSHIDVALTRSTGALRLVVSDDGLGSQAERPSSGGRGIPGMAERAHVLGGRLTAAPLPDGGFAVEAVLPLADDAPDAPTPRSRRAVTS